jgi:hypothetical protein
MTWRLVEKFGPVPNSTICQGISLTVLHDFEKH